MSEKSFWENLGRSFGYSLRKAKEAGSNLHDQAETKLNVRQAKERLAELYRELGDRVANGIIESGEKTFDVDKEDLNRLLEDIRRQQERITQLETQRPAEEDAEPVEREKASEEAETTNDAGGKAEVDL